MSQIGLSLSLPSPQIYLITFELSKLRKKIDQHRLSIRKDFFRGGIERRKKDMT